MWILIFPISILDIANPTHSLRPLHLTHLKMFPSHNSQDVTASECSHVFSIKTSRLLYHYSTDKTVRVITHRAQTACAYLYIMFVIELVVKCDLLFRESEFDDRTFIKTFTCKNQVHGKYIYLRWTDRAQMWDTIHNLEQTMKAQRGGRCIALLFL
jgi:hypothetical protein